MTDNKLLIQETQNLLRLHLGKSHSKYRKLKTTLKEARGKQLNLRGTKMRITVDFSASHASKKSGERCLKNPPTRVLYLM